MLGKIKVAIIVAGVLSSLTAFSKVKIKVGVLAPEGTSWAKNMKKMAKEIKDATKGKVKIKFYFGGSQGDEHDVLRKIRIGQLQGGVFTGKTLGDISGDVRVVEIPFTFGGDRKKAWDTVQKMSGFFNKKFSKAKFKNLGFFEIGMVYFVSQTETPALSSLKGLKIWSWEGDKIVSTMIDAMKLVSVPLPLPDVLSSLSTGIIEAAYAPPMGLIALQWNTKIKYLVDFPVAFSTGAFLIDQKKWSKISPENQALVEKIGDKYLKKVSEANVKDNVDSMEAMKAQGIKFLKFPKKDTALAKSYRSIIVKKLKGNFFTPEALILLEKYNK